MTDLRAQLQSSLGDAYTIERELGGGGMSRVFLATERALNRHVVIKILPSETAGSVSIDRFKREIELAARLQQANIVPLLSAGEAGGVPYFTMPYVAGESLRVRLSSGELPVPEAIGILKEVARALAYAHGQNVVHRDIKPDNVLLSGGSAVVTDFGVAKALKAATTTAGEQLTGTGLAIGTPLYMAPEQASGDPNVDHRADIYAFGCLAYELFSGTAPFYGRTPSATIAAHLTEAPDPVERRRPAVPWQVATLVNRCLAKNPADRPQNAAELITTLDAAMMTPTTPHATSAMPVRRSRGPLYVAVATIVIVGALLLLWPLMRPGLADASTVAVMPFANTTGDTTVAYLAEGLSDEMRVMLSSQGLSVKARGSSIALAGKDVKEIGSRLGVGTILQGTLTRTSSEPQVVAELVRVRDETVIWNGTFSVKSTASTTARDSLVRTIASAMRARLAPVGAARASESRSRGTSNDTAYEEFLKGEYVRHRFDYVAALPHLERAIALDPDFARAHASIAITYASLPLLGSAVTAELLPKARASADRALELSPGSSRALTAKGLILWFGEFRAAESEAALRNAVAADPADPEPRMWHAFVLNARGGLDSATKEVDEVLRLDPLSVEGRILRQAIFMIRHQYVEARAATQPILDLDPKSAPGLWNLSEMLVFSGKPDSGVVVAETMFRNDSTTFGARAVLGLAYAAAGRWKEAREQRRLAEGHTGNSPNYYKAMFGMAFGDFDAAVDAVDRGLRAHEPLFNTVWVGCEPYFEPLHTKPKFVDVLKSFGLEMCPVGPWPLGPPKP